MKNLWKYLLVLFVFTGAALLIMLIFFNEKVKADYERIEITLSVLAFILIFAFNILKKTPLHHFTEKLLHLKERVIESAPILGAMEGEKPFLYKPETNQKISIKKRILTKSLEKSAKFKKDTEDNPIFYKEFDLGITSYKSPDDFLHNKNPLPKKYIASLRPGDNTFQAIIGEAGQGKSYLLMKMLHETSSHYKVMLEKEVNTHDFIKVPVYLELGSWKNLLNDMWLHDRLLKDYKIKDKKYRDWLIKEDQLIFYLDGLDEVADEEKDLCYNEIRDHALNTSIVLTCRKEDYVALLKRAGNQEGFDPPEIYELIKFGEKDVERILREKFRHRFPKKAGKSSSTVEENIALIRENTALWQALQIPLILNLLLLTYEPGMAEVLKNKKGLSFFNQLWRKYDDHIFNEKLPGKIQLWIKIRSYTVWLSKLMMDRNFFVEHIQPVWLAGKDKHGKQLPVQNRTYLYYITARVIVGVLFGAGIGCVIGNPFDFIGNSVWASLLTIVIEYFLRRITLTQPNRRVLTSITLFTSSLILFCGMYQGFSVPRSRVDMHGSFSITESFAGILLGLIFGLIFGFRFGLRKDEQDILPLEKSSFNLRHSVKTGLQNGLWMGGLIGCFAVLIEFFFSKSIFYDRWLGPALHTINIFERQHLHSAVWKYLTLFLFAFTVVFFIAFFISALLGGRGTFYEEAIKIEKDSINYGIKKSRLLSFSYGFIAFSAFSLLYILVTIFSSKETVLKGFMMGGGMGIITFLWFGGIELINHWVLRIYLSMFGILPVNIRFWLKHAENLALIRRSGASIKFYHPTLEDYFYSYDFADVTTNKTNVEEARITITKYPVRNTVFFACILGIFLSLLARPYFQKYVSKIYWTKSSNFILKAAPQDIAVIDDSTVRVLRPGTLYATISGRVKVGTYVGYTGPEGVITGMFGVQLGSAYNKIDAKNFKHGALLYKMLSPQLLPWDTPSIKYRMYWLGEDRHCVFNKKMNKGDTLRFGFNDNEYENNTGHFTIRLFLKDTIFSKE